MKVVAHGPGANETSDLILKFSLASVKMLNMHICQTYLAMHSSFNKII